MATYTARHAREIVQAEARYTAAKRAVEAADDHRKLVRAKHRHHFALGIPKVGGGYRIVLKRQKTGASFAIAQYLKANTLTAAMSEHYSPGGERDAWTVEALPEKAAK